MSVENKYKYGDRVTYDNEEYMFAYYSKVEGMCVLYEKEYETECGWAPTPFAVEVKEIKKIE